MRSNRFGRDEYIYYIDMNRNRNADIYVVGENGTPKGKYLATAKR